LHVCAAVALGACFWLPWRATTAFLALPSFTERFYLLMIILGNQFGFLFVSLRERQPAKTRGETSRLRAFIAGVVAMLICVVLGLCYDEVLRRLFGPGTPTLGLWAAVRDVGSGLAGGILFLGILVGPLGDEGFFRGLVLRRWAEAGRPQSGLLVSSTLFALSRLDVWNFLAYIGMGWLLGWFYLRTGSLLTSWTAHSLLNSAMFALLYWGYQ
jgi:membrane protease YdiL (CAAX protease family)